MPYVQGVSDGVIKTNGDTLALPGNATAGNHILVMCNHSYSGCPVTITDSQGNTYTRHFFSDFVWSFFTAPVASSAALTVTFNMACGQSSRSMVVEVSGLATPHYYDMANRTTNTTSPASSGGITPDTNGQYLAVWGSRPIAGSWAADSPFTERLENDTSTMMYQDYIQPTAALIDPSMTVTASEYFPVIVYAVALRAAAPATKALVPFSSQRTTFRTRNVMGRR
jgi:hypothetical protein